MDDSGGTRVPDILVGTIIPSAIATVFVFARLYARAFLTRSLGQDDAWIAVSWVLGLALSIIDCLFINYGFGHHLSSQTAQQSIDSLKIAYVSRLLYQLVIGTTKIGLCAFYLRVFRDKRSRIYIYVCAGFVFLYTVPIEIYVTARCGPANNGFLAPLCHKNTPDLYISAICNILADVALLVFVVPRIMPLKMARQQKIALLGVACLGILVVVGAICRLVFAIQFNLSNDKTWDLSTITTWSAVEVSAGLFCASAPAIKPLIRKLTPRFLSSSFSSHAQDGTSRQGRGPSTGPRGIELGSRTSLNYSRSRGGGRDTKTAKDVIWMGEGGEEEGNSNRVWRGAEEESKGSEGESVGWNDGSSEEAIVGGIVKTVSVTVSNARGVGVTGSKESVDQDRGGRNGNGVVRFEPV